MPEKKIVLVDEIEVIYSLEIDGAIRGVLHSGDCEIIDLSNIFLDLKCSELPESINFFLEDESNEALKIIDVVEIEKTENVTTFCYALNTNTPEDTRSIISEPVLLRKVAELSKSLNLGVREYYGSDQPYIYVCFSTEEDLLIRDKILPDMDFVLKIHMQAKSELLAMLKNGEFYFPVD